MISGRAESDVIRFKGEPFDRQIAKWNQPPVCGPPKPMQKTSNTSFQRIQRQTLQS